MGLNTKEIKKILKDKKALNFGREWKKGGMVRRVSIAGGILITVSVLVFGVVFRLNQISRIVLDNENNIVQAQGPGELKPYKNKWLSSYETLCFDTADGDLDKKQYALDEGGNGYYIRTKSKDESQFEWKDLSYDVSKLEKVNVVAGAHCYYDEFLTAKGAEAIWGKEKKEMPNGGIIRIASTAKKYWDTARIKDYPQPERTEMVKELPPPEPEPASPEHHSIAFDATSNSGPKENVSSYSWSHTCTGDNRLLVIGSSTYNTYLDQTVSGITYNSDSLTYIRSDSVNWSGQYWTRSTLYYCVAPDTGGSYTVAVTLSGTVGTAVGGAISYTGAAQTGQPDANNGANNTTGTPTVSVTTVADNSWVVSVTSIQMDDTLSSNNTGRWKVVDYWWHSHGGSDTNGPKTPAGAQIMSWSADDGVWAISAASFAPAGEAGTRPVASSVSIDSGAASITLAENATKNVVCTAVVTDNDGYADITSVEAKLYRTGVGAAAADDNNNHYTLSGDSQCVPSGGTGNTENYTCTFAVQYYADPTDTGSVNEADTWTCQVTPSDAVGAGTAATDTIEMDTLTGLSVTETINYGEIALGASTASNQTVTITNTGNECIDVEFDGYGATNGDGKAMTCTIGSVPIANEKYGFSDAAYDSLTWQLSDTAAEQDADIVQRTDDANPSTKAVYFGFKMSDTGVGGSCSGKVNFTAYSDPNQD